LQRERFDRRRVLGLTVRPRQSRHGKRLGQLQRIARRSPDQHAQFRGGGRQIEVRANHRGAELQHRHFGPGGLERRDRSGGDARAVHARQILVGSQCVGNERARGLGGCDIDPRERHVLPQRADRIGKLRFGLGLDGGGQRNPRVALARALDRQVDAPRDLGRTGIVVGVEAGAQQIEMIGT